MAFWDRFRSTKPADPAGPVVLQEAGPPAPSYDPDANLSATGGGSAFFRRLTTSRRDLEPLDQQRAQDIAYYLYDSNAWAKRIIETTTDYILGEGVSVQAEDDDQGVTDAMQAVIDRFWTDPVNRWDLKLPNKINELSIYGEQCYSVFVNPVDGHVRLGYIDPGDIVDVITHPDNAEISLAVVVKPPDQSLERRYYRIVHVDENPGSPTYQRLVGVESFADGMPAEIVSDPAMTGRGDTRVTFTGSCFWFTVNNVSNAKRGRPDLLTIADWIDALDQLGFGEVDRALLMKAFVWDVSMAGISEEEAERRAKAIQPPKPGAIRVHNEKTVWTAVTPDLKAVDAQAQSDLIKEPIATGAGIPKTWLSGTIDVNLATATALSEPTFKHLSARQRYVRSILEHIITFVLDQAELHGRLAKRAIPAGSIRPPSWKFSVQMPELRPVDMQAAGATFSTAVNGLVAAQQTHLIDAETAQQVLAVLVGQFGVDVDLEQMRERIEKEKAEAEREMAMAPYGPGAGAGGQPQPGAAQPGQRPQMMTKVGAA